MIAKTPRYFEKKTRLIKDIDSVKTIITKFLRKLKFLQVHLYNETEVSKLNSSSRITCIVEALIHWHHRYKSFCRLFRAFGNWPILTHIQGKSYASTCSEIGLIDISLKVEVLSTAYTRPNNKKIACARASIFFSVNSHQDITYWPFS